jgi:siroheme synthase
MDYGKQCDFIFFDKDIDDKTLDFSNSKARFITKSPRDKTDQIKQDSILKIRDFLDGIEIFKI